MGVMTETVCCTTMQAHTPAQIISPRLDIDYGIRRMYTIPILRSG